MSYSNAIKLSSTIPMNWEEQRIAREETIKAEKERLAKISKPLYELVFQATFDVNRVISKNIDEGTRFSTFLFVDSLSGDIPRILDFEGLTTVRAGERINALIPRFNKNHSHILDIDYYTERPYTERESAIEISILSPDGGVLRIEQASGYEYFQKSL